MSYRIDLGQLLLNSWPLLVRNTLANQRHCIKNWVQVIITIMPGMPVWIGFSQIKDVFDIDSLHLNQKLSLECIMERKDVFLSTRTGSGMSICSQYWPSSDDSHCHWHTITCGRHTSQCECQAHNQWHWQSGQVSYPGGTNPVECLTINVKWWKLEFGARNYIIFFDNKGGAIRSMFRRLCHLAFGQNYCDWLFNRRQNMTRSWPRCGKKK